MKQSSRNSKHYGLRLAALYSLGLLIQSPLASAQSFSQQYDLRLDESADQAQVQSKHQRERYRGIHSGAWRFCLVELQDIPIFGNIFDRPGRYALLATSSLAFGGRAHRGRAAVSNSKFSEYIRDPQVRKPCGIPTDQGLHRRRGTTTWLLLFDWTAGYD